MQNQLKSTVWYIMVHKLYARLRWVMKNDIKKEKIRFENAG